MFQLYNVEKSIFRFEDYSALLAFCRDRGVNSALEFGPGISTMAMIEAGVSRIVTCEYMDVWRKDAQKRFARFPQVEVIGFRNTPVVEMPPIDGQSFDMAFVDSPVGQGANRAPDHLGQEGLNRYNTLNAALDFAPAVLLHDAKRDGEQASLRRLESEGHKVSMIETAKGIAVIERDID